MNIVVLNGSPRPHGNTAFLVDAFREGAQEAGHTVTVLPVASMKIAGCLGCEYCHGRGQGKCIQKDDHPQVIAALGQAELLVLASPLYFFEASAQLLAAIQRMHATGMPRTIRDSALLLSSGSPGVYAAVETWYKNVFIDYLGCRNRGIFTAAGSQNKTEKMRQKLYDFGRNL